jgi:hypothetical protein
MPSPNYSSRDGASVRGIIIHTAEGATTYQSLGNYFANPNAGVSSHVGIDDTPNEIGEYVQAYSGKAWTACDANPIGVQVELCAFAAWTRAEWDQHPVMLENCAKWIAEESARFGIPIVHIGDGALQAGQQGVCDHGSLGSWGGGHWDVGDGFPWDRVIDMAKGGPGAGPPPQEQEQEDDPMVIVTNDKGGQWLIWGSFRTQIANPTESERYKKAGAKMVDWPEEQFMKFPIAQNAVK